MPRPGSMVLYSELHSPRFDGCEASDLASGERPAIVNAVSEIAGTVELTVFTPYGASVRHDVKRSAWRWPGPEVEQGKATEESFESAKVPESVREQLRDGSWPATAGEGQSAKPADPVVFPSHEAVTEAQSVGDDQAEAEAEAEAEGEPEPGAEEGEKFPEPPAPDSA